MAFLRLAENPRDEVAGGRLLPLVPGIGPGKARQLMAMLAAGGHRFEPGPSGNRPPAAATVWPKFVALIDGLTGTRTSCRRRSHRVRQFYAPLLEAKYDNVRAAGSATWSNWS